MPRSLLRALALVAVVLSPAAAHAQGTLAGQTGGRAALGPSNIISVNPFLPIAGYFQGEFERRLQDNLALAVSGSYTRLDDYYTNLDVKLRLYPQERALHGIGIAAGLGYGNVRRSGDSSICDRFDGECRLLRRNESAPTFSVETHYQWLLGSRRATAVAIGGGVKRYFISNENASGIQRIIPTLRLTIGYAWR
jgi:hypothetical protein